MNLSFSLHRRVSRGFDASFRKHDFEDLDNEEAC